MRWLLTTILALSLAAVALIGCSCSDSNDEATSRGAASSTNATTAPDATSADGEGLSPDDDAAAPGGGDATGGSVGGGLSPAEQADLEAELAAIERELDAMALPSDADFADIEGALQ